MTRVERNLRYYNKSRRKTHGGALAPVCMKPGPIGTPVTCGNCIRILKAREVGSRLNEWQQKRMAEILRQHEVEKCRQWRLANPEKSKEASRKWRSKNRDVLRITNKEWYAKNREKKRRYNQIYNATRRKELQVMRTATQVESQTRSAPPELPHHPEAQI